MQPGLLSLETHTAAEVAQLLQLAPLQQEGGYFRRTAESDVLRPGGRWALISNVVAPEFLWSDFVLGDRAALSAQYPAFGAKIAALTRG